MIKFFRLFSTYRIHVSIKERKTKSLRQQAARKKQLLPLPNADKQRGSGNTARESKKKSFFLRYYKEILISQLSELLEYILDTELSTRECERESDAKICAQQQWPE